MTKRDSRKLLTPKSKPFRSKLRCVLSLYTEGNEIQSLWVEVVNRKIHLVEATTYNLIQPLSQITQEVTTEIGGKALSAEDIFSLEEKPTATAQPTETPSAPANTENLPIESNEELLAAIFRRPGRKKFSYAVNLPAQYANVVQLRDGYEQLKRKVARKQILAKINERLSNQIIEDHFDYFLTEEQNVFAFAYNGEIPLVELYESIQRELKTRHRLALVLPNEVALSNLLRFNGGIAADETIIMINIGPEESQIVITRGGKIVQIGAAVRENFRSAVLLKTIAGKILYEQNIGNLPEKFRLMLTGKARQLEAAAFFKETLDIEEIEYFAPDPALFEVAPEIAAQLSEYAVPLGLAITALSPQDGEVTALQLVPEYINRRQQVFKLAWHGYLLLLLIFLTPIWINSQYSKKAKVQAEFNNRKNYLERSIQQLEWAENLRDSLAQQLSITKKKLELLEKLSAGSYRWSYTLERIKAAIQECGGYLWITDLTSTSGGVQLNGVSLYRNRPSRLVARFPQASVLSVVPAEIRGERVYRFQIMIQKLVDDEKKFNPVAVVPTGKASSSQVIKGTGAERLRKAQKAFAAKQYDQALETFADLMKAERDPELQTVATYWYGKTLHVLGQHSAAVRILHDFAQTYPDRPEIYDTLLLQGKSLMALNQSSEAKEIFLRIMRAAPMSPAGTEAAQLFAQIP